MALTQPRKIVNRDGRTFSVPVAAGVTIIQSGLVILAAGVARPGRSGQGADDVLKATDAATYRAVGVSEQTVVGGVSDGAVVCRVKAGVFNFANSAAADAITAADIGQLAYVVDDQTVAKTSAGGIRCSAGPIVDVDSDGVWVDVGAHNPEGGTQKARLQFAINETDTLAGTSAELISPVTGFITMEAVTVQKAVTTGGTVSVSVGVTPVAGLSIAVANAAAKGTVATKAPTAQDATRAVTAGQRIQVIPAGFAAAGAVSGFIEISFK